MSSKMKFLKYKIEKLKWLDEYLKVYGSSEHKYNFNPKISEYEIEDFEDKFSLKLPEDYKDFLIEIGNGGAGPFFGLEKLENGIYTFLDCKDSKFCNRYDEEFPHTDSWNIKFNRENIGDLEYDNNLLAFEQMYFDSNVNSSFFAISTYGIGQTVGIVLKGKCKGEIWVDDRANKRGIYPDFYFGNKKRVNFLQWYELWIDCSLKKI